MHDEWWDLKQAPDLGGARLRCFTSTLRSASKVTGVEGGIHPILKEEKGERTCDVSPMTSCPAAAEQSRVRASSEVRAACRAAGPYSSDATNWGMRAPKTCGRERG